MFSLILTGCKTEADLAPILTHVSAAPTRGYDMVLADPGGLPAAVTKLAKAFHAKVVDTGVSLAQQKNQAAQAAEQSWLVFVPAGMTPLAGWEAAVHSFINNPDHARRIGIFTYRIDDESKKARKVEVRTAFFNTLGLTGGRQGVVVHGAWLNECGGFDDSATMEEVALLMTAKKRSKKKPVVLDATLLASSADYTKHGYFTLSFRRTTAVYLQLLGAPRSFIEMVLQGKLG